jgi:hypothetical protein
MLYQTNPLDWKIKFFTQQFANYSLSRTSKLYKISRNLNSTADTLAKQAFSAYQSNTSYFEPVCSNYTREQQCPVLDALLSATIDYVNIIAAGCC